MNLLFEDIYLYSQNPEKLYHFLSFLMDIEADTYEEHKIVFRFSGVNFVILPCESNKIDEYENFSLSVESKDDLIDLKNNIEFYYYKEQQGKFALELGNESLSFTDPDGRQWKVKLRHNAHNTAQSASALHVRNC